MFKYIKIHPNLIIPGCILFLDQIIKNILFKKGFFEKNYSSVFNLEIDYKIPLISIFLLILFLYSLENKKSLLFPTLLLFAGIISNSIDRIRFGFIIDYIPIANLFIFNLADIAILLSFLILFWKIIKE